MSTHFGVTVREGKRGLKLTRETYAIISDTNSFYPKTDNSPQSRKLYEDMRRPYQKLGIEPWTDTTRKKYTDEWCQWHYKNCLENFDLNMEFFAALSRDEFDTAITTFLDNHQEFRQISDLNICAGKSGYYMMVLDEYCQVYIGTTDDIKRRIQQHWSSSKPFDRLLFPIGAVDTSILSVDSFRAYDTTRIYAYITPNTYESEDIYINHFSAEFVCNRLAGGKITGGLLQAIAMKKQRQLNNEGGKQSGFR